MNQNNNTYFLQQLEERIQKLINGRKLKDLDDNETKLLNKLKKQKSRLNNNQTQAQIDIENNKRRIRMQNNLEQYRESRRKRDTKYLEKKKCEEVVKYKELKNEVQHQSVLIDNLKQEQQDVRDSSDFQDVKYIVDQGHHINHLEAENEQLKQNNTQEVNNLKKQNTILNRMVNVYREEIRKDSSHLKMQFSKSEKQGEKQIQIDKQKKERVSTIQTQLEFVKKDQQQKLTIKSKQQLKTQILETQLNTINKQWKLKPNYQKSIDYFSKQMQKNSDCIKISAGNYELHYATLEDLSNFMHQKELNIEKHETNESKVLEVMSGAGRNLPVLLQFYKRNNIQMLDGCKEFTNKIKQMNIGKIYTQQLQNFSINYENYGLVLGIWVLCYLREEDAKRFILQAKNSEIIILAEPILTIKNGDTKSEMWQAQRNQQMVLRQEEQYDQFFTELGLTIVSRQPFGRNIENAEPQVIWALKRFNSN